MDYHTKLDAYYFRIGQKNINGLLKIYERIYPKNKYVKRMAAITPARSASKPHATA